MQYEPKTIPLLQKLEGKYKRLEQFHEETNRRRW